MTTEKMEWDADASSLEEALRKQILQSQELEKALNATVKTGVKGYELMKEALNQNNKAAKESADEIERLKGKLSEIEKSNSGVNGLAKSFGEVKGMVQGIIGCEVVQWMTQWIDSQDKLNQKIVQTQRAYDKVAESIQVQGLMKDDAFAQMQKDVIFPLTQELKTDPATIVKALVEARSQGVEDKDLKAVVKEMSLGAIASGVDESGHTEFQRAIYTKLQQDGKQITPDNVRAASLPWVNAAGQMRLSGEGILSVQQKIGATAEAYDVNEQQLLAETMTLKKMGGVAPEKGAQNLQKMIETMKSEAFQNELSPEVQAAINKEFESGNVMGAFKQLSGALAQDPKSADKILQKFGKQQTTARILLTPEAQAAASQTLGGLGDSTRFEQAVPIALAGMSDEAAAADAQLQQAQIESEDTAHKNLIISQLAEAEALKRYKGMGGTASRWANATENWVNRNTGVDLEEYYGKLANRGDTIAGNEQTDFAKSVLERYEATRKVDAVEKRGDPKQTEAQRRAAAWADPDVPQFNKPFESKTDVEKDKLAELEIEKTRLEMELKRMEMEFTKEGSDGGRGGRDISRNEKKKLEDQQRLVDAVMLLVQELQINAKQDKRTKRNSPND